MSSLRMHHRHHTGATVITLAGEIDLASAPGLHQFVIEVRQAPEDHLVFDLTKVPFMDSMGLRVLLDAYTIAERHGGAIHLTALQQAPARLIEITRLAERLHVHSSTSIALTAIAANADRAAAPPSPHSPKP